MFKQLLFILRYVQGDLLVMKKLQNLSTEIETIKKEKLSEIKTLQVKFNRGQRKESLNF